MMWALAIAAAFLPSVIVASTSEDSCRTKDARAVAMLQTGSLKAEVTKAAEKLPHASCMCNFDLECSCANMAKLMAPLDAGLCAESCHYTTSCESMKQACPNFNVQCDRKQWKCAPSSQGVAALQEDEATRLARSYSTDVGDAIAHADANLKQEPTDEAADKEAEEAEVEEPAAEAEATETSADEPVEDLAKKVDELTKKVEAKEEPAEEEPEEKAAMSEPPEPAAETSSAPKELADELTKKVDKLAKKVEAQETPAEESVEKPTSVPKEEPAVEAAEKPVEKVTPAEETAEKPAPAKESAATSAPTEEPAEKIKEAGPPGEKAQGKTGSPKAISPFGKEDTASELQKHASKTQDTLVDAIENAQVSEIKRSIFRSLTKLRAASIKEFDTIARMETTAFDEYNDNHHYRSENPLDYLHSNEPEVSLDKASAFHK